MNASDSTPEPGAAPLEDQAKVGEPLRTGLGRGRRFLTTAAQMASRVTVATVKQGLGVLASYVVNIGVNIAFPFILLGITWCIAKLTSGLMSLTAPNNTVTFKHNLVAGQGWRGYVEYALVGLILIVLVIVPGIFNEMRLDVRGEGHAQSALLKVITIIACALTGYYVVLLHAKGGPLYNVQKRPLIVGTIFSVVLLAPYYKSLARGCWRGGLGLLKLSTLTKPWSEMRADWRAAKELRRPAHG